MRHIYVNLGRCNWGCNTHDDVCLPNKTEDVNLNVLIPSLNESVTLKQHILCNWYKLDERTYNLNQNLNNYKSQCECKTPKKHHMCKKDYIGNPSTRACEIDKHLKSNIGDSVILCDKVADVLENVLLRFNDKKSKNKMGCFYILHSSLSVAILLLVIITICDYCIKHHSKQKNLLSCCCY